MDKIISVREFGRKGITDTPWIGDGAIVLLLSVIVGVVFHLCFNAPLNEAFYSAISFFCVLAVIVILNGFSRTRVNVKEGTIQTWYLFRPCWRTYAISQIANISILSNDWCRNNIILHMNDGKHHLLSVGEVDEFVKLIEDLIS